MLPTSQSQFQSVSFTSCSPSSSFSSSVSKPSSSGSSSAPVPPTSSFLRNNTTISLISGMCAGVLCTILCAPLDTVKVRLQVQGVKPLTAYSSNIQQTLSEIFREEGIRGVFRGVGPALCTIPLFWGVYWPMYDFTKVYLAERYSEVDEAYRHMGAAVWAGVVSDVITNPLWVTRTRFQTMVFHPSEYGNNLRSVNISTWGMIRRIYQREGFFAFYKGLTASFLGLSHVAIQFPLYEYLKKRARLQNPDHKESLTDLIIASMTAKFVASTITYPHEVIRSRLQDTRTYHPPHNPADKHHHHQHKRDLHKAKSRGLFETIQKIIRDEGFFALWSGLRVSLIRIVPATVATFVSYEYISRSLKNAATAAEEGQQ